MTTAHLRLYHAPFACSLAPYIALLEIGAEFGLELVDLRKGMQLEQKFLAINPKHKVPALVIGKQVLTENVAILLWIARRYPDASLLPTDELREFKAISLLAWFASGIHPVLTPHALPHRFCDLPGSEDSVRRCAGAVLQENLALANTLLERRIFFFEAFTVADAYFFWCYRRAKQFGLDVSHLSNCNAHYDRMLMRDCVVRAIALELSVPSPR